MTNRSENNLLVFIDNEDSPISNEWISIGDKSNLSDLYNEMKLKPNINFFDMAKMDQNMQILKR